MLVLGNDTKLVAKPILCEVYALLHINQGPLIAFNNLRKLCKIRQYNDNLSSILKLSNVSDMDVLNLL